MTRPQTRSGLRAPRTNVATPEPPSSPSIERAPNEATAPGCLTAALPDLVGEIHGEILDAAPAHARALVDLLHGRFRAPLTNGCLLVCLGLSGSALEPLTDTYGAGLEIGHVLKLRAIDQLESTDGLTSRHIHEINFLLEAHRLIPPQLSDPTP